MSTPEEKLMELGLTLPPIRPTWGSYVSCVRTGNLLFTAGQGVDEYHGKLGRDLTTEEGYLAAQQSMLNLLRVVKDEIGELSKVKQFVKILGMVNCTEDFTEHPAVMNGASDLIGKVFGDKGKHGRSAVGMAQLPNNTAIEIEIIIEIED
ncbi:RidA family protein [Paenisporosarcina sp. OV554]|jgi:enamine deaminase RidA (YjgF/YER057c/UK114 family)|uniref:RidA family protein n=1 Tax=Paenisporosarcina sp. OV554 TaxID=2135694 RepID=UPI000D3612D4|nr:RidA family protein [Paenisporosarcina sp. OV554]PUB11679.1 enamine deaminase RidA (YjgF/YER057c/UK114 family) [Paenisporosarcina sp. OV554]